MAEEILFFNRVKSSMPLFNNKYLERILTTLFRWPSTCLFTEPEGLAAQVVLGIQLVGLLVAGRVAEQEHPGTLEVQLVPETHREGEQVLDRVVSRATLRSKKTS